MGYKRDYKKAVKKSIDVLIDEHITIFPVDPIAIVNSYGWRIMTYTEMSKICHCTVRDISDALGSTDAVTKKDGLSYVILYNDTRINTPDRIRFTIAHEIGHILLGHVKPSVTKKLQTGGWNGGFDKYLYKKLECEANCFARNLLCPAVVLAQIESFNKNLIMDVFKISKKAADARVDFYCDDIGYTDEEMSAQMVRLFGFFINKIVSDYGVNLSNAYNNYYMLLVLKHYINSGKRTGNVFEEMVI